MKFDFIIYGTYVYILGRNNGSGMICWRLCCFSWTGVFDCSSRELYFAIQTLKTGKAISITVKRSLFLCLLILGTKQIFLKEKIQHQIFSRPLPNFIHYNHASSTLVAIKASLALCLGVRYQGRIIITNFESFLLKQRLRVIGKVCW